MKSFFSKWGYTLAILFVVGFGFFAVLKANYAPQPAEVMRLTHFERPEQIGIVTFRRFYYPIETQKIVMFGIPDSPDWNLTMVQGFIRAAAAEKVPFDVVLMQEKMDPLDLKEFPSLKVEEINMNTQTQSEFIDRVRALKAEGKRILVYAPNLYTSHLIEGNPINRYEKATGEKVLSISAALLATSHQEEKLVDPPCVGSERDNAGTVKFGCSIIYASRLIYRKAREYKDFLAIMNSTQPEDFLLMVADPAQKKFAAQ